MRDPRPLLATLLLAVPLALAACTAPSVPNPESPLDGREPCPAGLAAEIADVEGFEPIDPVALASELGIDEKRSPTCAFGDDATTLGFYPFEGGSLLQDLEGEFSAAGYEIESAAPDLSASLDGTRVTAAEFPIDDAERPYDTVFEGADYVLIKVSTAAS